MKSDLETVQADKDTQIVNLKNDFEKEIAEWKAKTEANKIEKASTEWKAEKELLEKQLGMARTQMEENRKLYESLKSAIDKTNIEDSHDQAHLLEVNKVIFIKYLRIFLKHWDAWKNGHRHLKKK